MKIAYQSLDLTDQDARNQLIDYLKDGADETARLYLEDIAQHMDGQEALIKYYEEREDR